MGRRVELKCVNKNVIKLYEIITIKTEKYIKKY